MLFTLGVLLFVQDVVYADIDHMDVYRIFTLDRVNYADLNDYFSELRNQGMRTVIILVRNRATSMIYTYV